MLNKISNRLAQSLIKSMRDVRYYQEVYVYGFELVISTLVCWTTIMITSLLLSNVVSGVVFIATFSTLRIFAGGYHAESYLKCFIISNLFYIVLMMVMRILSGMNVWIWLSLFLICCGYILKRAPIINPNQPISVRKIKMCQRNIKWVLKFDALIILMCIKFNKDIASIMILSIVLVAALMLISDEYIIGKED